MKKLRLGDFFVSYGWLFPIFLVVSLIAWYWPLTAVNTIKDEEKIAVYAECYEYYDDDLTTDLYNALYEYGVEEVEISPYSPSSDMIESYYTAFAESSDILFLRKSTCDEKMPDDADLLDDWIEFDDELIAQLALPEDSIYLELGGGNYGVMVYNATNNEYCLDFSAFGRFEPSSGIGGEDIYMLLRATSPNFGDHSQEGATENGIKAVQFLLERYSDA